MCSVKLQDECVAMVRLLWADHLVTFYKMCILNYLTRCKTLFCKNTNCNNFTSTFSSCFLGFPWLGCIDWVFLVGVILLTFPSWGDIVGFP